MVQAAHTSRDLGNARNSEGSRRVFQLLPRWPIWRTMFRKATRRPQVAAWSSNQPGNNWCCWGFNLVWQQKYFPGHKCIWWYGWESLKNDWMDYISSGIKLASCFISLVLPAASTCWRYISILQCLVSFGCSHLFLSSIAEKCMFEQEKCWKTTYIIKKRKRKIWLRINKFSAWRQEINICPVKLDRSSPLLSATAAQRGINAVWNSPSELAAAICQIKGDCQSLLAGRHRARSPSWCLLLAFVCSTSSSVYE